MLNFQMSRDDVERLLDMQVSAGRITPQLKEERLREYDMKVQQMNGQQSGMQSQQMYNQTYGINNQQPQEQQVNQKYPRVGPAQGYLNGPEMIGIFVLAIALIVAAKMDLGWLIGVIAGVMFSYVGIKVLVKDIKNGHGVSYIPVVAGLCGIGLLAWGIFNLIGSASMKESFETAGNMALPFISIAIGLIIIVGSIISGNSSKKKFTVPVQATCIELRSPRTGHSVPARLSPVYEYWYNGEMRRVTNNSFSNRGNPRAGEVREIFVSQSGEYGYYDPIRTNRNIIGASLLGAFFIAMGTIVVALV